MGTMDTAQCHSLLSQYQAQNVELRNRLYADFERPVPHPTHPLTLLLLGAVLGALVAAAYYLLRGRV